MADSADPYGQREGKEFRSVRGDAPDLLYVQDLERNHRSPPPAGGRVQNHDTRMGLTFREVWTENRFER